MRSSPAAGRVIENEVTGERIVIRRPAAETGGALLVFELVLAPGGHVPSGHAHPEQQERFTVLEGRVRFRVGGRTTLALPGDTVTVDPGTRHHFANADRRPARLQVEVRPALNMEELLATASALGRRERGIGRLRQVVDLALFLREFEREVAIPVLPVAVARALTRPLAWLATAGGLDGRYRRARAGRRTTGTPS